MHLANLTGESKGNDDGQPHPQGFPLKKWKRSSGDKDGWWAVAISFSGFSAWEQTIYAEKHQLFTNKQWFWYSYF